MNSQENTQQKPLRKKRKKQVTTPFDKLVGQYSIWLLLGLTMVLGFVIFWDYLSLHKIFYFKDIGSDSVNQNLADILNKALYGIGHFDLSNWSFYHAMGMPHSGGSNNFRIPNSVNILSDISQFFQGNSAVYAVSYKLWLNWGICAILGFLYLRVLGLNRFTAVVGGLLVAFCGQNVASSTWHSEIFHIHRCLIILLSFELLLSRRIWWLLPIALFTLSIPDLYFYTEFLAVYGLVRIVAKFGWNWKKIGIVGLQTAGLGLLSIVFRAPNFLRSVQKVLDSPRVSGPSSYAGQLMDTPIFGFDKAINYATAILRTFHNDIMGIGSNFQGWHNYLEAPTFYIGMLTLLLVPLAFPYFNRRQKIVYGSLLLFWTLIITFPFFRYGFYKFAGTYYKKALSTFIPISLWLVGMQALHVITKGRQLKWWWVGGSLLALLGVLYFPYPIAQNAITQSIRLTVTGFMMVYALLLLLLSHKKYRRFAFAGILLAVIGEVIVFNYSTLNKRPVITQEEMNNKMGYNDFTIDAADYLRETDTTFYRVTKDYSSGLAQHSSINDALAQGYYSTPSYQSHNPKHYIDFLTATGTIGTHDFDTRWSMGVRDHPILLSLVGTKYAFTKSGGKNFVDRGYTKLHKVGDVNILHNSFYLPLGVGYNHYLLYEDFQKLKPLEREISLLKAVVLTKEQAAKYPQLQQLSPDGINENYSNLQYEADINLLKSDYMQIIAVDKKASEIKGTISLSQPKMLFFSIPYDSGWELSVDGQKGDLEIVDVGLMGVMLPAGTHEVVLQYNLPNRTLGIVVMLLAFALFLFAIGWQYRHKVIRPSWLYAGLGVIFGLVLLPIPLSNLLIGIVFVGMLMLLPKAKISSLL
ncbi:MAG: YfhO family protein [Chitinophagales bacterium]